MSSTKDLVNFNLACEKCLIVCECQRPFPCGIHIRITEVRVASRFIASTGYENVVAAAERRTITSNTAQGVLLMTFFDQIPCGWN